MKRVGVGAVSLQKITVQILLTERDHNSRSCPGCWSGGSVAASSHPLVRPDFQERKTGFRGLFCRKRKKLEKDICHFGDHNGLVVHSVFKKKRKLKSEDDPAVEKKTKTILPPGPPCCAAAEKEGRSSGSITAVHERE